MARTLAQFKQWAAENLHEDEGDTVWNTFLMPRWVNQAYNKIVGYKVWNWDTDMIDLTWPAAAADEEFSTLYLPDFIDKIITLFPGTAVGTGSVVIVTATEMDRWRPTTGRDVGKDYVVLHGYYGVEGQLAANGVVTVTSSAGSGSQVVLVEGLDANDRYQREEITVAAGGSTAGTSTFKAGVGGLIRITLIGDGTGTPVTTTGIITATGDAGATTLFRCDSSWEVSKEHQRTELYAVASTTSSFTCRYTRRHYLVNRDQDVVSLPQRFDDAMEYHIGMNIALFRKKYEEVTIMRGLFNEKLKELIAWDNRQPGKKFHVRVKRQWGARQHRYG
jgi:hypothetical protein